MLNLYVAITSDKHNNLHIKCFRKNGFIEKTKSKLTLRKDNIRYHVVVSTKKTLSIDNIKGIMQRYHDIWGYKERV